MKGFDHARNGGAETVEPLCLDAGHEVTGLEHVPFLGSGQDLVQQRLLVIEPDGVGLFDGLPVAVRGHGFHDDVELAVDTADELLYGLDNLGDGGRIGFQHEILHLIADLVEVGFEERDILEGVAVGLDGFVGIPPDPDFVEEQDAENGHKHDAGEGRCREQRHLGAQTETFANG